MTQAITPDLVVDLRALPECAQDIAMGNLTGGRHMADLETLAGGPQYARFEFGIFCSFGFEKRAPARTKARWPLVFSVIPIARAGA